MEKNVVDVELIGGPLDGEVKRISLGPFDVLGPDCMLQLYVRVAGGGQRVEVYQMVADSMARHVGTR